MYAKTIENKIVYTLYKKCSTVNMKISGVKRNKIKFVYIFYNKREREKICIVKKNIININQNI